ncbi:ribosomal protein S7 [Serendipita vermifera]|nr:ribosomal protein S7 [Serendipita vermifera]
MASFLQIFKPKRPVNVCFNSIKFSRARLDKRAFSTSTVRSSLAVESTGTNAGSTSQVPAAVSQTSTPAPRLMIPPPEDPLLHYLTSHLMKHGERHKASRRVANILAEIHRIKNSPPLPILRDAIFAASPSIKMKSHKKHAKSLQVPTPLNDRQRAFFAIKWLISVSKNRSERKLEERVAKEVIKIVEGESEVLRKKAEVHKLAVANRSNAAVKGQKMT